MLLAQSLSIVAVIILIITIFFCYSRDQGSIKKVKLLDRTDKVIMTSMTLVYAAMSFFHFASFYKYENPWHGNKRGDELIVKFIKPVYLSKIDYFVGYDKGQYAVTLLQEHQVKKVILNSANSIGDVDKKYFNFKQSCVLCFRWQTIYNYDLNVPITGLIFTIDSGPVDLYKITIVDKNNQIIKDCGLLTTTNQKLEQNLIGTNYGDLSQNNWRRSPIYDELYYVTSAYEYLHKMVPDVGEHPQLAILLIALGISIFGFSSFGWRIISNMAGIMLIPLIYIFAKRIFKKRVFAILATILILIDPMHYIISKIAMLESFVTLFLVLEYYFLWCYFEGRVNGHSFRVASRNLLYVGMFLGLACSSKWSALFSGIAISTLLIYCELFKYKESNKQLFFTGIIVFVLLIVLPILIYLTSYIPIAEIFHVRNIFKFVFMQQKRMLYDISHMYSSIWTSSKAWWWVFNQTAFPISVSPAIAVYKDMNFDLIWHYPRVSMVVFFLNPMLLGLTLISIITLLVQSIRKDHLAFFLLLAIVSQYFPFFAFKRTSFIYYFYSVLPFVILTISYFLLLLNKISSKNSGKNIFLYIFLNIMVFIWFSPIIFNIIATRGFILAVYHSIALVTFMTQILIFVYLFFNYRKYLR